MLLESSIVEVLFTYNILGTLDVNGNNRIYVHLPDSIVIPLFEPFTKYNFAFYYLNYVDIVCILSYQDL